MKTRLILATLLILAVGVLAKKPEAFSEYNYAVNNKGSIISIRFEKGKEHNHPLFAIWLADENGKYIQTLFVCESVGHGIFVRANRSSGKWMGGEIQRPATLPYWAHQRGVINQYGTYLPTPKQPIVDAYTGATPSSSFVLNTKTEKTLSGKYKVMLEINQSWDWNEFWANDLYPGDNEYRTSSQPALVYAVDIDTNNPASNYIMNPVGHSHYSGADGSLTTDLSTITTALKIARKITVTFE
ncbi:MAG: hypothetical protein WCJ61_01895 [Paludibacter sp.]